MSDWMNRGNGAEEFRQLQRHTDTVLNYLILAIPVWFVAVAFIFIGQSHVTLAIMTSSFWIMIRPLKNLWLSIRAFNRDYITMIEAWEETQAEKEHDEH